MRFAWDATKAKKNAAKHRVSFSLAERVWDDPPHIVMFDGYQDGESRWHAVGAVA